MAAETNFFYDRLQSFTRNDKYWQFPPQKSTISLILSPEAFRKSLEMIPIFARLQIAQKAEIIPIESKDTSIDDIARSLGYIVGYNAYRIERAAFSHLTVCSPEATALAYADVYRDRTLKQRPQSGSFSLVQRYTNVEPYMLPTGIVVDNAQSKITEVFGVYFPFSTGDRTKLQAQFDFFQYDRSVHPELYASDARFVVVGPTSVSRQVLSALYTTEIEPIIPLQSSDLLRMAKEMRAIPGVSPLPTKADMPPLRDALVVADSARRERNVETQPILQRGVDMPPEKAVESVPPISDRVEQEEVRESGEIDFKAAARRASEKLEAQKEAQEGYAGEVILSSEEEASFASIFDQHARKDAHYQQTHQPRRKKSSHRGDNW